MKGENLARADRMFAKRSLFRDPPRKQWPALLRVLTIGVVIAFATFAVAQAAPVASLLYTLLDVAG